MGTAIVAHSKLDGYTILLGNNAPFTISPLTKEGLGYTLDDFATICNLSVAPMSWSVKDDGPYKTMKDFLQAAKTKKMKYSSYGPLTSAHIFMEALLKAAGLQAIHVPYPSAVATRTAVMGGHVDIGVVSGSLGMAGPGKIRIVAVAQENRFENYPEVPTLAELGYPGIYGPTYFSLCAPKGTPKEITNKIYEATKKVVEKEGKEVSDFPNGVEHSLHFLGPEELLKVYKADDKFLKKTLEEMGAFIK